ncbi:MAG: ABC transporter ATP-binding protein [Candidatus Hodarchaeota archaeon]
MTSNDVLLKVDKLTKTYISGLVKTVTVSGAKDVSFEINRGEIVSLVGESGSGKSTTANIILKLLKPTSGNVYLDGKDIFLIKNKDYYKRVQVIFQDPYGSYNLFYKIDRVLHKAFGLASGKFSSVEKEEIITDTLAQIGLNADEVLGRYPHQLSGGQLQRFLLARVLIVKPDLLIADEPTSMIDASSRAGILNLLQDLKENQRLSVLFITHDIAQAQYLSRRVIVMRNGEVVEKGLAEEVFGNPQHPYTQELLASVPMLRQKW